MNPTVRHCKLPPKSSRGAHLVPSTRSSRLAIQLQALGLEELLEAVHAVLAAVARLLVATEGSGRVERPAVDLDLAGADLLGDLLGTLSVGAPHPAGEAVGRVVGDLHSGVLTLVEIGRASWRESVCQSV